MKIRLAFSIAVAKATIKLCRLVRWGGTSLPGIIARKIYPGVLTDIAGNFTTIMVTGTNGKTTTTRIIGQILNENGIKHITNRSGANLVSGIITTFIEAVNLKGKSSASTALLEIDEAAFNVIAGLMEPDVLVVTNFFRDQLDRYGELYTTLKGVASGIRKSPKTRLVLNADDSLCASLAKDAGSEVVYYGFAQGALKNIPLENVEEKLNPKVNPVEGTECPGEAEITEESEDTAVSKQTVSEQAVLEPTVSEQIVSGQTVSQQAISEQTVSELADPEPSAVSEKTERPEENLSFKKISDYDGMVNSDAMFCLYCKGKYQYTFRTYGHLGHFRCPQCGYERPASQITCIKVENLSSSHSEIRLVIPHKGNCANGADTVDAVEGQSVQMQSGQQSAHVLPAQSYFSRVNLPGLYNIYNSLAAVACGYMLGLPAENSIKALGNFECGFGRMEVIKTSGKTIKVILVKNPTGFNQVISYLLTEDKNMQLAFPINDKTADGTDISWLWDVDFEKLQTMQDRIGNIYTSGLRAEDMAVRLKYAGIDTDRISVIKDYDELINTALSRTPEGHCFYILPSYTAMLDIRKVLKKKYKLKEFWK